MRKIGQVCPMKVTVTRDLELDVDEYLARLIIPPDTGTIFNDKINIQVKVKVKVKVEEKREKKGES